MPYTYVIHVIFVQLIGMGVLQWFRHDRAQTVVLCVMIHYCSVAIVVGYNKITALKIKPGCGPHHDYFFNTLVFISGTSMYNMNQMIKIIRCDMGEIR